MTERTLTVTTRPETTGSFREEWLSGKAGSKPYLLDTSVNSPVLTVNVMHGDRWVRESVDLTDMLTEWVTAIHKELKRIPVDTDE